MSLGYDLNVFLDIYFCCVCDILKKTSNFFDALPLLLVSAYLFHDGGPYHIATSPLICGVNQRIGFYLIGTSVTKELISLGTEQFSEISKT